MESELIVTIDGPAGSGKSTISKLISKEKNLIYLDTGAMYRSVAYFVIHNDEDPIKVAKNLNFKIQTNNEKKHFIVNGLDVTKKIRKHKVDEKVADISSIKKVRKHLVKKQREFAENKRVILEGRDTGTVVFPEADLKFYLDADIETRAKRRYNQSNKEQSLNDIKKSIIKRDQIDKNKKWGALKKPQDAIYIDTTTLSKKEVVREIISYIEEYES